MIHVIFSTQVNKIVLQEKENIKFNSQYNYKLEVKMPDGGIVFQGNSIERIKIEGYFIMEIPIVQTSGFDIQDRGTYLEIKVKTPNASHKFNFTSVK